MLKVTTNFDTKGIEAQMKAIIERQANEILNRRLASIKPEIAAEPMGRFVGTINNNALEITPEGFSPELKKKIIELFKD